MRKENRAVCHANKKTDILRDLLDSEEPSVSSLTILQAADELSLHTHDEGCGEKLVNILKNATEPDWVNMPPFPPTGRFRAMAAEAGIRRHKRLMHDTFLFLATAFVLICVEALLINASLLLFVMLQATILTGGVVCFFLPGVVKRREVNRS